MKKIVYTLLITAVLATSACHFGKKESKESLERNKTYKEQKAADASSPEVDEEYVKKGAGAATADTTAAADTTK